MTHRDAPPHKPAEARIEELAADIEFLRERYRWVEQFSGRLALVETRVLENGAKMDAAIEELRTARGVLDRASTTTTSSSRRAVLGQIAAGSAAILVNALILLRPVTSVGAAPVVVFVPSPAVSASVVMPVTTLSQSALPFPSAPPPPERGSRVRRSP